MHVLVEAARVIPVHAPTALHSGQPVLAQLTPALQLRGHPDVLLLEVGSRDPVLHVSDRAPSNQLVGQIVAKSDPGHLGRVVMLLPCRVQKVRVLDGCVQQIEEHFLPPLDRLPSDGIVLHLLAEQVHATRVPRIEQE